MVTSKRNIYKIEERKKSKTEQIEILIEKNKIIVSRNKKGGFFKDTRARRSTTQNKIRRN